jgi:hypothetical protein
MHTEVHVHGDIPLRRGVSATDLEAALRPWLDYVDVDSLAEATSAREDEPGISLDLRRRVLQICWTGYVGRNFSRAVEGALNALCEYAESTAEMEITYYHEDGRDEFGVVFVGPSPDEIELAKRSRMISDVAGLLGRQFSDADVREVTGVIQRLYEQQQGAQPGAVAGSGSGSVTVSTPVRRGSKHLH